MIFHDDGISCQLEIIDYIVFSCYVIDNLLIEFLFYIVILYEISIA